MHVCMYVCMNAYFRKRGHADTPLLRISQAPGVVPLASLASYGPIEDILARANRVKQQIDSATNMGQVGYPLPPSTATATLAPLPFAPASTVLAHQAAHGDVQPQSQTRQLNVPTSTVVAQAQAHPSVGVMSPAPTHMPLRPPMQSPMSLASSSTPTAVLPSHHPQPPVISTAPAQPLTTASSHAHPQSHAPMTGAGRTTSNLTLGADDSAVNVSLLVVDALRRRPGAQILLDENAPIDPATTLAVDDDDALFQDLFAPAHTNTAPSRINTDLLKQQRLEQEAKHRATAQRAVLEQLATKSFAVRLQINTVEVQHQAAIGFGVASAAATAAVAGIQGICSMLRRVSLCCVFRLAHSISYVVSDA
jgi:hypothetical protein